MRLLVCCVASLLAAGCAGLDGLPSLGTYHVDEERLVVLGIEEADTVAVLAWGDTVEVVDAPMDVRTSDDLFVVRAGDVHGRLERDALMSDLIFRSRYSHGLPIGVLADGRRYYIDEFADTVVIIRRPNLVRKPAARDVDVFDERELLKPKTRKRRR